MVKSVFSLTGRGGILVRVERWLREQGRFVVRAFISQGAEVLWLLGFLVNHWLRHVTPFVREVDSHLAHNSVHATFKIIVVLTLFTQLCFKRFDLSLHFICTLYLLSHLHHLCLVFGFNLHQTFFILQDSCIDWLLFLLIILLLVKCFLNFERKVADHFDFLLTVSVFFRCGKFLQRANFLVNDVIWYRTIFLSF